MNWTFIIIGNLLMDTAIADRLTEALLDMHYHILVQFIFIIDKMVG